MRLRTLTSLLCLALLFVSISGRNHNQGKKTSHHNGAVKVDDQDSGGSDGGADGDAANAWKIRGIGYKHGKGKPKWFINCGSLQNISNGFIYQSGTTFGHVTVYECNQGYQLVPKENNHRVCLDSGNWSHVEPQCVADCGPVSKPANGEVQLTSTLEGSVATYSCHPTFNQTGGSTERTCQGGAWTGKPLTCEAVDCGIPPALLNGDMDFKATTIFNTVKYACNPGFQLVPTEGYGERTCLQNGQWSGLQPNCVPDCGPVSEPTNGEVQLTSTLEGSVATYSCHPTFNQTGGSTERTCQGGAWTGEPLTCDPIDCGIPPALLNGNMDFEATTIFNTVKYACNPGFQLVPTEGYGERTCLQNGQWSGLQPNCVPDCGPVIKPANGEVKLTGTLEGSVATYSCHPTFKQTGGSTERTCQGGAWTGEPLTCDPVECGALPEPLHGTLSLTGTSFGSEAKYNCDDGYELEGSKERTCKGDGQWSGTNVVCKAVECSDPPVPAFGSVSVETFARYECSAGFKVDGPYERSCKPGEDWSPEAPVCKLICEDLPNPTFGTVTLTGATAIYSCKNTSRLEGSPQRTCQTDEQWSGIAPQCICIKPIDVVFVVDGSGSVNLDTNTWTFTLDNFRKELNFIIAFVQEFNIGSGSNGVQVGVVVFGDGAYPKFDLNTYTDKNAMMTAVNQITYPKGSTATHTALRYVRETSLTPSKGDRPGAHNVVIVMTDGRSDSPGATESEANKLKQLSDTTVYAIGIGSASQTELLKIASDPTNIKQLANFDDLDEFVSELKEKTC